MSSSRPSPSIRSLHQQRSARPRLSVVSSAPSGRRLPFVAVVVAVLAFGMTGLLVVNTSLQRSAFVVTSLRDRAAALNLREQSLKVQVLRLQSPQRLAAVAVADGMVHTDSPTFLSLKTGKVIGAAKPTIVPNPPAVYGGRGRAAAGKLPLLLAGSSNSASTGLQHHAAPAPRASSSRSSSQGSNGASPGHHSKPSGSNGRTQ